MAASVAFFVNGAVRAAFLFLLFFAGCLAPGSGFAAANAPQSPKFVSLSVSHVAKPRADAQPEQQPYAISREQSKSLRTSKKRPPPASAAASADIAADAAQIVRAQRRARHLLVVPPIDKPARPPRGIRFLSRAPPPLPVR